MLGLSLTGSFLVDVVPTLTRGPQASSPWRDLGETQ
jgi:hypothetical protein